jgi:hypothetical protein
MVLGGVIQALAFFKALIKLLGVLLAPVFIEAALS